MTTTPHPLPTSETVVPATVTELADCIQAAAETGQAVYPVGGGTSLAFGLPAREAGIALHTTGLKEVIEYPAGDMTITVQSGMVMSELRAVLAEHGQQLPLDVPQSESATIGGVLATNTSGPRRFGHGTARDYLIGVSAVDGKGRAFSGGGRVVKNVAGYDFCKLLTGSLGTLGVITQVTLKVKPRAQARCLLAGKITDLEQLEKILAAIVHSETYPVAVEYVSGPAWSDTLESGELGRLWILYEGTEEEVEWMSQRLCDEWQTLSVPSLDRLDDRSADAIITRLIEFPDAPDAALTLRANVVPSGTTAIIQAALEIDAQCSLQSHAGCGIVNMRFDEFPERGLAKSLTGLLRPIATSHHGNVIVASNPSGDEMTRQCVWGGLDEPFWMMEEIKRQFDPANILNPGRFVYS